MSSNINPTNINGNYPIAGQDNDSQGFRDNFTNILNNFTYAAAEISDLQSKALLSSPLTGGSINNNMSYNQLKYPQLFAPSLSYKDQGTYTSNSTLSFDYSQGSMQRIAPGAGTLQTVSFSNWPSTGQYASMLVWFSITNVAYTINLPSSVTIGASDIAGWLPSTNGGTITFDTTGDFIFEFSTVDGGNNLFIKDLTRNKATLRDPNLYFNDSVANTLFVGFDGSQIATAIAFDAGRNTVVSQGAYSSTGIGNLTLSNVVYSTLDTGDAAGYNITSARGNLAVGNVWPVSSGDQLGYINAVTFTGNGAGGTTFAGNTFTQISRIGFYATGSNTSYGLGGNIAFYTAVDGNKGVQVVSQALGIENDQSIHAYGNVFLSSTGTSSSYYPLTSSSTGTPGQLAWRTSGGVTWVYICIGTNTWNRFLANSTSW
jgi:hypothetical protein